MQKVYLNTSRVMKEVHTLTSKTNKMGRPKLDEPRSKNIQVRVTEQEYEKIKECARRNNCTATQLVREGIQKVLNP